MRSKKPGNRALPFYFYAAGVLAALAAAAVLIAAEVQGNTPAALDRADLILAA